MPLLLQTLVHSKDGTSETLVLRTTNARQYRIHPACCSRLNSHGCCQGFAVGIVTDTTDTASSAAASQRRAGRCPSASSTGIIDTSQSGINQKTHRRPHETPP